MLADGRGIPADGQAVTRRFSAGHLPGLVESDVRRQVLSFGAGAGRVEVDVPVLDPAQMTLLAKQVRAAARARLATLDVSRIITIIDTAIARLLDPSDPHRRELDALLPVVTGYDAEMIGLSLTSFLKTFRAPQLHRFVAEDFPNPKVLDEFQPAVKGGAMRAIGPALLVHSWAGNVPALPLWSLVCGLLVKSGNIGKLPSAEPVFATVFARLLAEVHPPLAECLAVVWWKGGPTNEANATKNTSEGGEGSEGGGRRDSDAATALYAQADVVLAYGSNDTLAQVRAMVPITTRFLPFGHKIGFALIGKSALDAERAPATARLAAKDVVRYDQQGCYSPHVLYVERGGRVAPRDFVQYLAAELASLEHRFPRRALMLEDAIAVAGWQQASELRAIADTGSEQIGDRNATWSVAYADAPFPLTPTAANRTLQVIAVDRLDDVVDQIASSARFLQTVGVAVDAPALYPLAERLAAAGVTRLAAIGSMTSPEAGWHHDGRFNLLDLVRMVEIELSAERMSDRLATYAEEDPA